MASRALQSVAERSNATACYALHPLHTPIGVQQRNAGAAANANAAGSAPAAHDNGWLGQAARAISLTCRAERLSRVSGAGLKHLTARYSVEGEKF